MRKIIIEFNEVVQECPICKAKLDIKNTIKINGKEY